ncbi:hypothetical protein CHISP_3100 [Chitinispirillum alkaliphilum]|nr:hypothetical protein CHISP_3100 [Chitinispirillum alkaliphilum]
MNGSGGMMLSKKTVSLILVLVFSTIVFSDFRQISNNQLNYSILIPHNWIVQEVSSEEHRFFDTTGEYRAQIGIVRHKFSNNDFQDSKEWTLVNYMAYELSAEYSHNPIGFVIYADSSSELIQPDSLRAAEIYARFCYLSDPALYWDEYIRFAATDTFGYEMYVIGDTADMARNVGLYAAIIQNIVLPAESAEKSNIRRFENRGASPSTTYQPAKQIFDLRGRRIPNSNRGQTTQGVYINKEETFNSSIREILIKGK